MTLYIQTVGKEQHEALHPNSWESLNKRAMEPGCKLYTQLPAYKWGGSYYRSILKRTDIIICFNEYKRRVRAGELEAYKED